MAASYLRRGMVGPATFSLFVRKLPPRRGFLVAAGLEDCLSFLESFAFADEDLAWLRDNEFDSSTIDSLAGLRFTGDVDAMPEGRVVLPDEPLLEVTAPIAEAQLIETYLLNQITFQTAIATKARPLPPSSGRHHRVGRLRAPPYPRRRRRHGGRPPQRHGGLRGDEQRRGRPPPRPAGGGHDGAQLHRGVPDRGRGVPGLRPGPPGEPDLSRRHL
jgi:hypothetical protein